MLAHLVVIQQALKEAITSSLGPKTSLEFCAFPAANIPAAGLGS